jgi:hypothetical protein
MSGARIVPGLRGGWFELSLIQGVNNPHTFAIEGLEKERDVQPEM